jgi:hypothetical protein
MGRTHQNILEKYGAKFCNWGPTRYEWFNKVPQRCLNHDINIAKYGSVLILFISVFILNFLDVTQECTSFAAKISFFGNICILFAILLVFEISCCESNRVYGKKVKFSLATLWRCIYTGIRRRSIPGSFLSSAIDKGESTFRVIKRIHVIGLYEADAH